MRVEKRTDQKMLGSKTANRNVSFVLLPVCLVHSFPFSHLILNTILWSLFCRWGTRGPERVSIMIWSRLQTSHHSCNKVARFTLVKSHWNWLLFFPLALPSSFLPFPINALNFVAGCLFHELTKHCSAIGPLYRTELFSLPEMFFCLFFFSFSFFLHDCLCLDFQILLACLNLFSDQS